MNDNIISEISKRLGFDEKYVRVVLDMLKDGATVPFIARYRKEQTGNMDENQIREISDSYEYQVSLEKRKADVIRLIEEKGLLTDDIRNNINAATKIVEIEDLYRPFKEKKQTKASKAIALGLTDLAKIMMSFPNNGTREDISLKYAKDDLTSPEDIIKNASYIISEWISDNASYRKYIRENATKYASIKSKMKRNAVDDELLYQNYYEYEEQISKIKPHRILAINRGEDENVLSVSIEFSDDYYIDYLNKHIIKKPNSIFDNDIKLAIKDSYERLIKPSIEREIRAYLKDIAEEQAIKIFGLNLKNLLLQAPIKNKVVLGVDPAFRTGCKMAVVNQLGAVLDKGVIFPNERKNGVTAKEEDIIKSKRILVDFINKYKVEIISIGNGTASRETEEFISNTIKEYNLDVKYVIVSEAGASVYSASTIAQEEFPTYHVEERSAVSIARRLQDPLAELVKIDPKAIGVGQYQHDVSPAKLSAQLDNVVIDAVNKVGVDVNTASISLLSYVSGINKTIAKNIVDYRNKVGKFKTRVELMNVSKLGPKAYEQAVGFIRIPDSQNVLDHTPIHPESYDKAFKIMELLNINDLGSEESKNKILKADREEIIKKINIDKYTLDDILASFISPTRDPRDEYSQPKLRSDIRKFEDLKVGEELEGTVRNVVDFGAFVDCGVKYDGLVHISKISTGFIKHPSDVLNVGDIVKVYVIGVDLERHKLSLSMIK